jgi:hypothetical protein
LVARDLKKILAAVSSNIPSKPSDLALSGGPTGFLYHTHYMVYSDVQSEEYPFVVFFCDSWNTSEGENPIQIMSFGSQAELNAWKSSSGTPETTPSNIEPIEPSDADEIASSAKLVEVNNFD